MPRGRRQAFIWIEPVRSTKWTVTINGTDVSDEIIDCKFMRGIIGEDNGCEIDLDNGGDQFTTAFTFGHTIIFKMDFSDGSTKQWEGEVEEQVREMNDQGLILKVKGSHYSAKLLDVTVTGEFTSAEISTILTSIVGDFLTGFTTTNVSTTTTNASVTWNNKPFWDCVLDLMRLANFDCYVDESKDFHFFARESIENDNVAFHEDGGLLEMKGLGPDSLDVSNKTIVYGEADGLPVIASPEDSLSQTTYGLKERIIKDTSITDEDVANDIGIAENNSSKEPPVKGAVESLLFENLKPGDMCYILAQMQGVHDRYRVIGFTYNIPQESMEVRFSKETTIPKLFKEREQKTLAQESIVNPFQMKYSFNFTFDNENKIDTGASNNVSIDSGSLKLTSGVTGFMESTTKATAITVGTVHLMVKGETISGNTYQISTNGGTTFETVAINEEVTLANTGTSLRVKVTINSADARLDALAVLYK